MKFKLPVPKIGLRTFIGSVIVLWFIATATGYIQAVAVAAEWGDAAVIALGLGKLIGYVLLGIVIMLGAWRALGFILRWGISLLATEQVEIDLPAGDVEPAREMAQAVQDINEQLRALKGNSKDAAKRLQDIEMLTHEVTGAITATIVKVKNLQQEVEAMRAALRAIGTGQADKIAEAAGMIGDTDFRRLLLAHSDDPAYTKRLGSSLAFHLGTVQRAVQGYQALTSTLLSEIELAKSTASDLEVKLGAVSAAPALLQIKHNLSEIESGLQLLAGPDSIRPAVKSLPVSGYFLRG